MAEKPKYKDPAGLKGDNAAVPAEPPFVFRNVNARIFPIKANMARLGFFVHQYLNMDIPPEIAHFRPALPYVYLLMLNYGKLEPASIKAQNIGWISQHEVLFSIPLEWWRGENGRLVFHDWACVNPFIFVDDEVSLTTGREVYGWPKVKAEIHEEAPLWTTDPRSSTRLLNLKTKLFPKLFAGAREENRELLQIYQDPPPCFSQIPLDLWNPWFPLTALQVAASGWMGVMGNALDIIAGLPIRGYRAGWDPSTLLRMFSNAGRRASGLFPDLQGLPRFKAEKLEDPAPPELKLMQITLKQFHHPERPFEACYQAIVGSDIALDSVNRMGLLGDENLLRGDFSGGFTIRIYRYAAQPIVDKLGLEEVRVEEGTHAAVSIFKPTFPFWADTDLYYGKGHVICSRPNFDKDYQPTKSWEDNYKMTKGGGESNSKGGPSPKSGQKVIKAKNDVDDYVFPFNTVCGGATQPIAGPFIFPDVTVQAYPLKVENTEQLQAFLKEYLNETLDPGKTKWTEFKPWGSYVYLLVMVYADEHGKMWSENNNIGWFIEKEVSICVPVNWFKDDSHFNYGMVSPFQFGHTGRAVISNREINGRPVVKANIESYSDVWLNPSGPAAKRKMLKLDTEIYPGRYMGQRAENRTLIEIIEGIPRKDSSSTKEKGNTEKRKENAEYWEKILSLIPINWVHLKQHCDAHNTEDLCYQALVKTGRRIIDVHKDKITGELEIKRTPNDIDVRFHRYPGHRIANLLGLNIKNKDVESCDDSAVDILRAVDPFWMRIKMVEPLGEVVCFRTKSQDWVLPKNSLLSKTPVKKNI